MEKLQLLLSGKLLQSLIVIHWERGTRIFKMPLKQDKETTKRPVVYTPKKPYSLFKHHRKERDITLVQLYASTSIPQKKLKQAVRSLF